MAGDDKEYQSREDAYAALLADAGALLEDVRIHTKRARKAMDQSPVDANTLSNEIVELAILNQQLGDRVASAGRIKRDTENYYKTVREEHKVRLCTVGEEKEVEVPTAGGKGTTITTKMVPMALGLADSAKMKLSEREFNLANFAEELFDQLNFMRRSSDKTIDAIRSKLSFEKIDLKNS